MGYVFDFQDAQAYDSWYRQKRRPLATELELRLMQELLAPAKEDTVLDIGCGTGGSLKALLDMGLSVTGLDPSPYVLDIAYANLQHRVDLYRGFAEDLPFGDNSFNHACFFLSLEFVDNPRKALEEAARVAKDRVFIGVLNRYAFKGLERRLRGIFTNSIFNKARFFSIWELKYLARAVFGDMPVKWRTVCQLPGSQGRFTCKIENSSLVQRFPFGAFAGLAVTLVPRFRTRPLAIKYQAKSRARAVGGLAGSVNCEPLAVEDTPSYRMAG